MQDVPINRDSVDLVFRDTITASMVRSRRKVHYRLIANDCLQQWPAIERPWAAMTNSCSLSRKTRSVQRSVPFQFPLLFVIQRLRRQWEWEVPRENENASRLGSRLVLSI